nr:unnamed protein product [Digitaria exilis]
MSGDTEIIPSSGQGSETAPLDSNAETEIVNPASDGDDSNESSSQRNRTKVSTSQANVVHVDKVIINKKLKDRLSRVMESVPRVIPDNEPAEVEPQAATGEALGPSVFIQAKTNATALQDAAGPSKVWDYSGPPFNLGFDSESQEKDEMANSQPQEAHVHVQAQPEEVQQDQDVHVPPHSQLARNEERPYENVGQPTTMPRPEPSSANRVTEQINVNTGCFNNVVPLVAVDSNGVVLYDNTPPTPEGNVVGETFHVQPSSFDQLHRTNDEEDEILICLGSTSKNQHPERKRFQAANVNDARINLSRPFSMWLHLSKFKHPSDTTSTNFLENVCHILAAQVLLQLSYSSSHANHAAIRSCAAGQGADSPAAGRLEWPPLSSCRLIYAQCELPELRRAARRPFGHSHLHPRQYASWASAPSDDDDIAAP